MCAAIDEDVVNLKTRLALDILHLLFHRIEVYYCSRSYDVHRLRVEYAAWQDVKREFSFVVDYGVPRVISSLVADNDVRILGEVVDYPTFSLVSVLHSNYC